MAFQKGLKRDGIDMVGNEGFTDTVPQNQA